MIRQIVWRFGKLGALILSTDTQLSLGFYPLIHSGGWLYYTCMTLWLGKRIELKPYRGERELGRHRDSHYLYFRSSQFATEEDPSQEVVLDALRPDTYPYEEVRFRTFRLAYRVFRRGRVYLVETHETLGQLLSRILWTAIQLSFSLGLCLDGLRQLFLR